MSNILALKREAAEFLSREASQHLAALGETRVADVLAEIHAKIHDGRLVEAFEAYRELPRHDVAGLHQNFDWMLEEGERAPAIERALAAAYYQQALAALGDLRVSVLYGFERPPVTYSAAAIQALAEGMVSPAEGCADGT